MSPHISGGFRTRSWQHPQIFRSLWRMLRSATSMPASSSTEHFEDPCVLHAKTRGFPRKRRARDGIRTARGGVLHRAPDLGKSRAFTRRRTPGDAHCRGLATCAHPNLAQSVSREVRVCGAARARRHLRRPMRADGHSENPRRSEAQNLRIECKPQIPSELDLLDTPHRPTCCEPST